MPRALSTQEKEELAQFLDRLYELGGYVSQSEWAQDADVHEVSLSKVRSRSNGNQINAHNLFKLIRAAAGRAAMAPTAAAADAATGGASVATIQTRLEAIAGAVAEIGETQKEILQRVPVEAPAVQRSRSQAAPRQTRKGSK